MSEAGRRRLLVALARAEEDLIETHVRSALDVIAAIGDELPIARTLDIYMEAFDPGEPRSSIVARRVLTRLDSQGGRARGQQRRRGAPA